jgi:hypothetical protein
MSRSHLPVRAAAVALLALCAGELESQVVIGRIDRIAEVSGARRERQIREPTVRVQRLTRGEWESLGPGAVLRSADQLRVQRFTDVRVAVEGTSHRGTLILLPELMDRTGTLRVFPATAGATAARDAQYNISTSTLPSQDLTVNIGRGALVVDWAYGRLSVVAAGTRTLVTGTRLLVEADDAGETGTIYLETGQISFPDYPDIQAVPGQVVYLQRGVAPLVQIAPPSVVRAARSSGDFHLEEVWAAASRLWMIPAVAAVATTVVVCCVGPEKGPSRAVTVVVKIPVGQP